MTKLYNNLDVALANLNHIIDSGQFFTPIPKKKKAVAPKKPAVFVRKVGALTISSDEPFNYRRFPSFKDKIKVEGVAIQGQLHFTYTNAKGERANRSVSMIAAFPNRFPEYLVGYCELRMEERTFKLANIETPIDPRSDMPIIELEQWLLDPNR